MPIHLRIRRFLCQQVWIPSVNGMVSMSEYDTGINDYLTFIISKLGTKNTGQLPEKITPGVDHATYLERVKFQDGAGIEKSAIFQRELRK